MAIRAEKQIATDVLGLDISSAMVDRGPLPYYVLALDIVQKGGNFRDVFEAILRALTFVHLSIDKRDEAGVPELVSKGIGAIDHPLPNLDLTPAEQEIFQATMESKEGKIYQETLTQCRRLFRGFRDLSVGGRAFFKDKFYLEGSIVADNIIENGIEQYLFSEYVDPIASHQILGLDIRTDEVRDVVRDIALEILKTHDTEKATAAEWLADNAERVEDYRPQGKRTSPKAIYPNRLRLFPSNIFS